MPTNIRTADVRRHHRRRGATRHLPFGPCLLGLCLLATLLTAGCTAGSSPPVPATGSPAVSSPSASLTSPTSPPTSGGGPAPAEEAPTSSSSVRTVPRARGQGGVTGAPPPVDPAPATAAAGVVTDVVDGDTVDVTGLGRVRLVGVDAPERGACGSTEATARLRSLVLGKRVGLVPDGRDDRDRYGRLLRYVDVAGTDAGRDLLAAGLAVARYDSRDGYGAHPREAEYVAIDARTPNPACGTGAPAPVPARPAAPAAGAEPWNRPGPDLDCADIRRKVAITGPDYHRLDADRNGWGCESYG